MSLRSRRYFFIASRVRRWSLALYSKELQPKCKKIFNLCLTKSGTQKYFYFLEKCANLIITKLSWQNAKSNGIKTSLKKCRGAFCFRILFSHYFLIKQKKNQFVKRLVFDIIHLSILDMNVHLFLLRGAVNVAGECDRLAKAHRVA
jgi:hypothetical protein